MSKRIALLAAAVMATAGLAVSLAATRIHVDAPTDQALVRDFISQLGEDGLS